ncbi:MAG: hypothetical protein RL033_8007 [Pseudomonadota bacterium]
MSHFNSRNFRSSYFRGGGLAGALLVAAPVSWGCGEDAERSLARTGSSDGTASSEGVSSEGAASDGAAPEGAASDGATPEASSGAEGAEREAPVLDPGRSAPAGGNDVDSAMFIDGDSAPVTALAPASSCAATVVQAESIERVIEVPVEELVVVPSVFYLMLDSSGSMVTERLTLAGVVEAVLDFFGLGQRAPNPTKWDFTLAGLDRFINDPASAGLPLALGYFPDGGACDGTGYDVPSVPLASLPDNILPLQSSLAARVPDGNTPLEGALRGATNFCLAFNAEHPEASCVAVLITDGAADQCDARDAESLAAIAASAAQGGVLTFAAGMQGADFSVLDAIGQAGGGDCDPAAPGSACDLTAKSDAFVAALNGIRDRTRTQTRIERRTETERQRLPCEWEIPAPPPGSSFEPGRVNVRLTLPGGSEQALSQVPLAAGCADAGGWYYDDALAPRRVLACPSTCETLSAAPETRVDLLFGCRTVLR